MGRAWRRSPPRSALPSERIAPSGATADDLGLCILTLRLYQAPTFVVTSRFLPCSLLIARVRKGRLRELVWVGGCVTAPAAWASGPSVLASRVPWGRRCRGTRGPARSRERPWVCRSVHRSAKMASRRRFGHLCTLLRRCGQTWGRSGVRRSAKMASRRNHRSHAECALW